MQSYDFLISELLLRIRSPRKLTIPENFQPFLINSSTNRTPEILMDFQFETESEHYDKVEFIKPKESAGRGNPCRLLLPENISSSFCQHGCWLNCFPMEQLLLPWGRMILHASAVIYQGEAYVFAAPSGVGKSTHAALWEKHFGAKILNGDKVILHHGEHGVMASGGPVAGSSGIYQNETVPVVAVYLLKQGPENRLERVPKRTAILSLYSQAVKSYQDTDFNSKLLDLAVSLGKQLNIFSLECVPEKSAVECILKNRKG